MGKAAPLTEALYYILLSLGEPNHGYGIIQQVSAMTEGRLVLGAGTLYGAISGLLEKGWIILYHEETDARRKKEYLRTPLGTSALEEEISRLRELLHNAQIYMESDGRNRHAQV
ncbi:MAG: helix-turn-helix transcriptional regulator [Candidatus Pelethousia sp.]|nr:helix-turn-helix transcriptional regulator [Candidatus Pelethousia sp.]